MVDAVDSLVAEGRALAEQRLYRMVREHALPEPVWNVDLRLPGGPHLGGVDAFWPEQAVALELDTRAHRHEDDAAWAEHARKREHLERLGIPWSAHLTPRKLRDCPEHQAAVVRTALMAAWDREPAANVRGVAPVGPAHRAQNSASITASASPARVAVEVEGERVPAVPGRHRLRGGAVDAPACPQTVTPQSSRRLIRPSP
ncbi:hypothetical protein SVIOM342S_07162 [Streptomyces violaceorubidus]